MYAQVVLSSASSFTDNIYDYSVPENLKDKIQVGAQVAIPFGNRQAIGYTISLSEKANVLKTKDIIEILSPIPYPLFSKNQVELAKWIADYYKSFFITALRLILPPGTKQKEGQGASAKGQELKFTKNEGLEIKPSALKLTEEQQNAFNKITEALKKNQTAKFLLYGVTGSGKTEVYFRAIEECLKLGKTAIILVPEIILTPQIIQRYKGRFENHLAVLHSDKTLKQRDAEWWRAYSGEAKVILGIRSALFAPLKNLGLIVMDEEYETSYKQDKSPRYHTRKVAEKLCEINQAVLLLGSATPSIETFYKAKTGAYGFLELTKRIDNRPLPPVEIVDMRQEKGILSKKLKEEIKTTLAKNAMPAGRQEKIILFLNRRGFFRVSFCERCGETVKCPNCSVSLIFHELENILQCGHRDYKTSANITCPHCGNANLGHYGIGTQRIEKEVANYFKDAKILRVDKDSIKKRGSSESMFTDFYDGKANVLIGTQLVTKGMDLTDVTLVGIVNADVALNIPDFRAAEHTFQSITQVAGRAGRHHLPGKVIIQTYNPEHYAIKFSANHDYENFYNEEIKFRQVSFYPPFSHLINIEIQGEEEAKAVKAARMCEKLLEKFRDKIKILGPAKAPIEKLRGNYRYYILLKAEKSEDLHAAVDSLRQKMIILSGTKLIVDVDPISFL